MYQDLTSGNSLKRILTFFLPLLIGTVFQQFYNMVDAIIVGKLVGVNALAAVGLTGSITFLVLGLVFGTCSGFAIPVAQDFGAKDETGVRRCVANILYIGSAFALFMTVATSLLTPRILQLINTPDELFKDAYDYLFWTFIGISALMLYNLLAGILRAMGDSRSPLLFLILSSLLNVGLDVLFVQNLRLGISGAAIATVVSQLLSGIACLLYMLAKYPMLRLTGSDLRIDPPTIRRLLGIGLPMGLQFSITAIGSIILQASINGLGTKVVAAIAAAGKIQNLVSAPMDSLGVTSANFAGQNFGAGNIRRIRKGVFLIYMLLLVCSALGFLLNWKASGRIALLFVDASETTIIQLIRTYLFRLSLFYPFVSIIYALRNALQGVGFSKSSMVASSAELLARGAMGMLLVPVFGFDAACFAHPLAWIFADLILIPVYFHSFKKLGSMEKGNNASPAASSS